MPNDALPFGRFSPAKGLTVDTNDKSITITGQMEVYGSDATAPDAVRIQNTINKTWTQTFPDGYRVTCNVTVRYRAPGVPAGNVAQIEIVKTSGASNVNYLNGRKMTLNTTTHRDLRLDWTAAHEFGHVIGMEDRYSESIMSKLKNIVGMEREGTVAHKGYEGNLMGASGGAIGSQNLRDAIVENQPSPFWMNDDDQVRNWITSRASSEISNLSAANKIKAIKVLMGGWISDDDMRCIEKICLSVKTGAEARTIEASVQLNDFTSLGQRTQMRVIFSRMPR